MTFWQAFGLTFVGAAYIAIWLAGAAVTIACAEDGESWWALVAGLATVAWTALLVGLLAVTA